MQFEKIKKDHTAARRMKRYRARKLNRQRGEIESIYRERLESLYDGSGFRATDWVLGTEFFDKVRLLFGVEFNDFSTAVRIDPGIETARLKLDGESVLLVRPKYFLEKT